MFPLRAILHPTNFSEASEHALRVAYQLARDYKARLILLNALEPPLDHGDLGEEFHAAETVRDKAHDRIAHLVDANAPVTVDAIVVEGFTVEVILGEARERRCDLIVIGSHGRTGLGRALMGSVAEDVARKACCPVLIVRECHEVAPADHVEGREHVGAK